MTTAFELAAPQPMKSLTSRVVDPANVEVETRRFRAEPIPWAKRRKIKQQIKAIERKLKRGQYDELLRVRAALKSHLEPLWNQYRGLKERLAENPTDTQTSEAFVSLKTEMQPEVERWWTLESQLEPLHILERQRATFQHMLDDHPVAVARLKAESKLRKDLEKEASIYGELIINRWTRLGFKHVYTHKGKEKTDKVKFSNVSITLDGIYFEIMASHKTAFNNWKSDVPDGVYIVKELLAPETLAELSLACKKQVTGVYNNNGAWVIVHRLESIDGLMNYVKFSDVMQRYPAERARYMPCPVGVSYNREIQWIDLASFPHWLIGGYTGSGKSNAVNSNLCSLIRTQSPEDLRIFLCDLKGGLEFSFYKDIPHLHGEIVDEPARVADMLNQLEAIMELRFKKFKGVAKKIEDYHLRYPDRKMPRILCVFDEFASIQGHGDVTKRISASVLRLTRLGRAVGIHMWLCTQQPDVKVIEGGIKTNLPLRMSGRMPTSSASVTVLGNSSAAALAAVAGRMILQLGPDPLPIQTPHISDEEIEESLAIAKRFEKPQPLEMGNAPVIHEEWTPERIVELSIKHLNGNIAWKPIYDATSEDLSQGQARKLVEAIWATECIHFEGNDYRVERGEGWRRKLVKIEPSSQDVKI